MRRPFSPEVEHEVNEELSFHLEMRTRELIERGLDPVAARAEAERRLGDRAALRTRLERESRGRAASERRRRWFAELAGDLRLGGRSLRRSLGFTALAVFTLALGLGATTAIFGTLYAVVLRPLPIPDPERVLLVNTLRGGELGQRGAVSVGNLTEWEARSEAEGLFSALGAISWQSVNLLGRAGADEPERLLAGRATADYFAVFGIPPVLGRTYTLEEDRPGADAVVVLSDRLWRRRFGADPEVVGSELVLSGVPHRVIGVMPPAFDFTLDAEELWLPAAYTAEQRAEHDEHYLTVYGRLAPGVAAPRAEARIADLMHDIARRFPNSNHGNSAGVMPLMEVFVGPARERLQVLFGAVLLVLLIACANVANLLLARGSGRVRELQVRAALGASRGRLVRQLLAEGLVLALLAGALGSALAWVGVRAIVAWAPPGTPRLEQAAVDGTALAFALALALGSTLLFALVPALRSARAGAPAADRSLRARGAVGGWDGLRQSLVAIEVALVFVLLVGSALLVRTAAHLGRTELGFEPRGLVTARLALPAARYDTPERARLTFEAVLRELEAVPGVERASLVTQVPLGPGGGSNGLVPEGKPQTMESAVSSLFRVVPPGHFATLGVPLRHGRDFHADDRVGGELVMIVNERLARELFPGQDPIGRRVSCCEGGPDDPRWKSIVGVVADVRTLGPGQEPPREFFLPLAQAPDDSWEWYNRTLNVVLRARGGDPMALVPAARAAVQRVDPTVPLYAVSTLDHGVAAALAPAKFNSALLGALAVTGLVLALVGIYGVVSYLVARRRPELGVRQALGASPGALIRLVVSQGLRPVFLGLFAGALGALATARVLGGQLRGVSPTDPLSFAVVATVLAAVAVLAAWVPARRATRVDSLAAIRSE